MGSLVSAAYAALYPDQIDSLTIMCIPGRKMCVCARACVNGCLQVGGFGVSFTILFDDQIIFEYCKF